MLNCLYCGKETKNKYCRGHNPNSHLWTEKRKESALKWCKKGNSIEARKKAVKTRRKTDNYICSINTRNKIKNTLLKKYKNNEIVHWTKIKTEKHLNSLKQSGLKRSKRMKKEFKTGKRIHPRGMLGKTNKWGHHTKETKNKLRIKTINQILNSKFNNKGTSIELIMKAELEKRNINFIHQFNFNHRFVCDFAIPEANLIIECDGDYWHNREDIKKHDILENTYITKYNWKILRFWEHELKNNINNCINIIVKELIKRANKEEFKNG